MTESENECEKFNDRVSSGDDEHRASDAHIVTNDHRVAEEDEVDNMTQATYSVANRESHFAENRESHLSQMPTPRLENQDESGRKSDRFDYDRHAQTEE